jgi:hypothetical protein
MTAGRRLRDSGDYDPSDDMRRSIEFAYEAIRERVAHGGRGWREWPEGRPVYVLRLQSPNGDDARRLRWALKKLLRQLGLKCLSIEIEVRQ